MPDFQLFFFSIEMNGTQTFFVGIRPRNQDKKILVFFLQKQIHFAFFQKNKKIFPLTLIQSNSPIVHLTHFQRQCQFQDK